MAAFDPYHKWLGIPPAEQPVNHYRLLGVTQFESDPDVIDAATEQRVSYLRQCATGQHIAESQKLLNEVAAARLCLLNAEKKRGYDQKLRQTLKPTSPVADSASLATPRQTKLEENQPVESVMDSNFADFDWSTKSKSSTNKKSQRSRIPMVSAVVLLAVALWWGLSLLNRKDIHSEMADDPSPDAAPSIQSTKPASVKPAKNKATTDAVVDSSAKATSPAKPLTDAINLLADLQPAKFVVAGNWEMKDGQLLAPAQTAAEQFPRMKLPTPKSLPREYDVTLTVERLRNEGFGLTLGILMEGRQASLIFDGFGTEKTAKGWAIDWLDERGGSENGTRVSGPRLLANEPKTITVQVRQNGLTIQCAGEIVLDWKGDPKRLGVFPNWQVGDPQSFFLGSMAPFKIHSIQLAPSAAAIQGDSTVPNANSVPSQLPGESINLLADFDPKQFSVAGDWMMRDGRLLAPAQTTTEKYPRIKLPIPKSVPREYDISLIVERQSDVGFGLNVGLLIEGQQTSVAMDGYNDPKSWAIDWLEGRGGRENGTLAPGQRLPVNQRKTIDVQVRRAGITVKCAGETVIDWKGDPKRLGVYPHWRPGVSQSFFLGSMAAFTIHEIRLTPIGTETQIAPNSNPSDTATRSGARAFLTELKPSDVFAYPADIGFRPAKITVDGRLAEHTFMLHPPEKGASRVSYDLYGQWATFRSSMRILRPSDTDRGEAGSALVFEVWGDGQRLWKSEPVAKFEVTQNCEVDVRKVKTLQLRVVCPGPPHWAQAVWIEPVLSEEPPPIKDVPKADNSPPNGFTALFNGKDLTGWKGLVKNIRDRQKMTPRQITDEQKQADERMKAHWRAVDGVLVFDGGGENLVSSKDYGNFELYVDWKIGPLGDSGVYLRGTPQIQICDPDDPKKASKGAARGSGGLYNNLKTSLFPDVSADNPIGQWNTFFIRMVSDKVTVVLNGKTVVNNVAMENYWEREKPSYPLGPIELQSYGSTLYFKNIYVRELPKK
jgi:hypothetical protein